MEEPNYIANLPPGTKVRLAGLTQHVREGQAGTIIRTLPNPSERPENQWYDLRFPDGSIGRFPERYLVRIDTNGENRAA
jgi:hypothetical protein